MAAARAVLAVLAALSLWLSALPAGWAIAAILVFLPWAVRRIRRDASLAPVSLRIADDGAWLVLLEPLQRPRLLAPCQVQVRGGLAWVRARGTDGRSRAWAWWPDTLDAAGLRKLRLAARGPSAHSAAALATMPG